MHSMKENWSVSLFARHSPGEMLTIKASALLYFDISVGEEGCTVLDSLENSRGEIFTQDELGIHYQQARVEGECRDSPH